MRSLRRAAHSWFLFLMLAPFALPTIICAAQENPSNSISASAGSNVSQAVTVHGMVRNVVTHDPLVRVLVQVGGESGPGVLTDNEGRFEISGIAPGPQIFQLTRPGFRDAPNGNQQFANEVEDTDTVTHNIFVTAGMPDIELAMKPTNAIRGQIELSTGEPAEAVSVMLLHKAIQDGRAVWRPSANARTNSNGVFRFAGLDDGTYAVYSEPSMESDLPVTLVQPGREDQIVRNGYPMVFYPDAREFSGAGMVQLDNGEQVQANIRLPLEPFHMLRAEVSVASRTPGMDALPFAFTAAITDASGHQLPYVAQYDSKTHAVQAMLPDGTYTLRVSSFDTRTLDAIRSSRSSGHVNLLSGQADVTMAGKPAHLRVALSPETSNPVQVNVARSTAQSPSLPPNSRGGVYIMVSQAGGAMTDGMISQLADGAAPGTLQSNVLSPGQYWVHTTIGQPGLCEASFTAGGANLAREPLVVGIGGVTAPLILNLRDDCASLKLSLSGNASLAGPGEEKAFSIYVVPDFDSTVDITPMILRPSSGGTVTFHNLSPGSYHVYAFSHPVELEYRNREVLARIPSQAITLEPASTNTLVVEAPAQ